MSSPIKGKDAGVAKPCLQRILLDPMNAKVGAHLHTSSLDLLERPNSALARHRVHQLSDIGEVSSSSKQSTLGDEKAQPKYPVGDGAADAEQQLRISPSGHTDVGSNATSVEFATPVGWPQYSHHDSERVNRATSTVSLPLHEIPERRSSISMLNQDAKGQRRTSLQDLPSWRFPLLQSRADALPSNGRAISPLRATVARGAQSSEVLRTSPARTFVRTTAPMDMFNQGPSNHRRFMMSIRLPSPIFVGGGTVEGQLELQCDQDNVQRTKLKPLFISRLSVDVVGVEELGDGKRHMFLALATELFDIGHPPPPALVTGQSPVNDSELLWETRPANVIVPFCVNLPLKLGPPPYLSKAASIRYLVSPSAILKVGNKYITLRQTWNCQMFTVHDPEKALGSLASPLIASDVLHVAQSLGQYVKLSAGLHRQTWVNGCSLFTDIHVVNNTSKTLKKIELMLEKTTLFYSHAAAGTAEKSASHLRLAKRSETELASSMIVKTSHEWRGVLPQASEIRTCELKIPRGHVTIASGRHFEVRYFVRVIVHVNLFKTLAVQLPVTVIHINSLDILPNSLAQVTASIEAKRSRAVPHFHNPLAYAPYRQGQVFRPAHHLSPEQADDDTAKPRTSNIQSLKYDVDSSPRRRGRSLCLTNNGHHGLLSSATTAENFVPSRPSIASHHHHTRHPSCYHCHLIHEREVDLSASAYTGPKLPRLQVSTSGLGFSESEFEIPDSPPRKVMLSEQERKMIMQQRELKLKREWSLKHGHASSQDTRSSYDHHQAIIPGYKNVATRIESEGKHSAPDQKTTTSSARNNPKPSHHHNRALPLRQFQKRARSKTNPEIIRSESRPRLVPPEHKGVSSRPKPEIQSMDRGRRVSRVGNLLDDDGAVFGFPPTRGNRVPTDKPFVMHGPRLP